MTKSEFISELQEMLQTETDISGDTNLLELEEWDSLAFMILIAFFDKNFGMRITFEDLQACDTPAQIIRLANGAIA